MANRIRKAVFPVGGMGTRFLPATKSVPKELFPIGDRPAIQLVIDEAAEVLAVDGRLVSRLEPVRRVGLGYLTLGQPLSANETK